MVKITFTKDGQTREIPDAVNWRMTGGESGTLRIFAANSSDGTPGQTLAEFPTMRVLCIERVASEPSA